MKLINRSGSGENMRLEGQTKFARNVFFEVKKILIENNILNKEIITLKEILEALKLHPEWLWYYPIPNMNGLFHLQGVNRLSVPYLNLGINNHYFSQENLLFEFHFDINGKGTSLQTNNEYLRNAIYRLIEELYTEKFYDRRCRDEMKILGLIAFRREYFPEEIKTYTKNK